MLDRSLTQAALALVLAVSTGACAATPNVWELHDMHERQQRAGAVESTATVCPVLLTNHTDMQLDAGFEAGGVSSVLGLIPAGRSLGFSVACDVGPVQAFAVSNGGFLGGPQEYRAVAPLRRGRTTELGLSLANRVR